MHKPAAAPCVPPGPNRVDRSDKSLGMLRAQPAEAQVGQASMLTFRRRHQTFYRCRRHLVFYPHVLPGMHLTSALPQATLKRRYCNRQRFSSSSSAKRKRQRESRADVEVSDRKGSAKTLIGLRGRVGPSRARGVQRRSRDVFGVTTRIARMHASIALAMTMTEAARARAGQNVGRQPVLGVRRHVLVRWRSDCVAL